MTRTYLSALEGRIRWKIPTQHPIMRWLVEHAASMLNRFTTNADGVSPYAYLHGRNSSERHIEFGEKIFYYVPKRARSKLCMRWRLGIYLGMAQNSNEIFVATVDGDVTKARSAARVVEAVRWDAKFIVKIHRLPGKTVPMPIVQAEYQHIEEHPEPHVDADEADRRVVDVETTERAANSARITDQDLRKYGFHPDCPKCEEAQTGKTGRKFKKHSDECRWRIYEAWRDNNDPKFKLVEHLFREPPPPPETPVAPENLDLDSSVAAHSIPAAQDESADALPRNDEPNPSGHWDPEGHRQGLMPDHPFYSGSMAPPVVELFQDDGEDEVDADPMDMEDLDDAMIDTLRLAGVSEEAAFEFVKAMRIKKRREINQASATFVEMYGGGSICREAENSRRSLNLKGLNAFDLRTLKPDGTPWNFCRRRDREEARAYIREHKPDWVIGSPPCTSFCLWNRAFNFKRMDPEVVRRKISEGRKHLSCCISIYGEQMRHG